MKKSSYSTDYSKQYHLVLLVLCLGLILSSGTTTSPVALTESPKKILNDREILDEIKQKLENNGCLDLLVSSVSVKLERSEERAFATYGSSELLLENGTTLRSQLSGITTNFNDEEIARTTKEHMYFVIAKNTLKIKVRYQNWGDQTVELKDAKIEKREQGYFATGNHYNGRKVVYYTIAIYDDYKRGCISGLPRK
eukprot:GHVR01158387.1.p1 GENE.GHVR01158387.1~~GHVR01158387.1.p1  ORF type:complete len:196 (-),score=1.17 GHVR01158387.1:208-795(-)